MQTAAQLFEGTHDFAAFHSLGGDSSGSIRTVRASDVRLVPPAPAANMLHLDGVRAAELLVYEVRGDGFLRHMVRTIAGTLVEVGRGRRGVDWMAEVLASRDRARAGPTAPAEGLFLLKVDYDTVLVQ
jgi:tRNA pseudouridine38-40 synthase